jgi:predicted enzyme involved in methoxymalonyl-ACP biosynthesis
VRAKGLINCVSPDEAEVRRLAAFALDLTELGMLGKAVLSHREFLIAKAGYTSLKLGIVASHTMDYLAAALPGTGLRHGLLIDVVLASYGQAAQELLDPGSDFATQNLNCVLLAFDFRALGLGGVFLKKEEADEAVSAAINYVHSMAAGVRNTIKAPAFCRRSFPHPIQSSADLMRVFPVRLAP